MSNKLQSNLKLRKILKELRKKEIIIVQLILYF